jgi:hypothetical protein
MRRRRRRERLLGDIVSGGVAAFLLAALYLGLKLIGVH